MSKVQQTFFRRSQKSWVSFFHGLVLATGIISVSTTAMAQGELISANTRIQPLPIPEKGGAVKEGKDQQKLQAELRNRWKSINARPHPTESSKQKAVASKKSDQKKVAAKKSAAKKKPQSVAKKATNKNTGKATTKVAQKKAKAETTKPIKLAEGKTKDSKTKQ